MIIERITHGSEPLPCSPRINLLLIPDKNIKDAVVQSLLSSDNEILKQKRLLHGTAEISSDRDLQHALLSIAGSGTEEVSTLQALACLKEKIDGIGDSALPSTPLGLVSDKISALQQRLLNAEREKDRYVELSIKIGHLEEKRLKIEQREHEIESLIPPGCASRFLSLAEEKEALSASLSDCEEEIRKLKAAKEALTRRASGLKEEMSAYGGCLDASEKAAVLEYEDSLKNMGLTAEERERINTEIEDKEKEITAAIEPYRQAFCTYDNSNMFSEHMDEIEEDLSKARVMNEKTLDLHNKEKQIKNLRITEWLCLIPSLTLIAFTITVLYINGFELNRVLIILMGLTALLGISCFLAFIKCISAARLLISESGILKTEISEIKGIVDKAKSILQQIQKHYGSITSTELRIKFKEYQSLLTDLENVRKLADAHNMSRTQMHREIAGRENSVRAILQKAGCLSAEEPLTEGILKIYSQKCLYAEGLKKSIDGAADEYRSLLNEMDEVNIRRTAVQKKIQALDQAVQNLFSEGSLAADEGLDAVMEQQQLGALHQDYRAEIAWLEKSFPAMRQAITELPALEEELAGLRCRHESLERDRQALAYASSVMERVHDDFIREHFIPLLLQSLKDAPAHFARQEQAVKAMLEHPDEEGHASSADNVSDPALFYIMLKHGALDYLAGTSNLPMILDGQMERSGSHEEALKMLVSLSEKRQFFSITDDHRYFETLKSLLESWKIGFSISSDGNLTLLAIEP